MVNASDCKPEDCWFESSLGVQKWGISSDGRASALHAEGQRFDPAILHQISLFISAVECFFNMEKVVGSSPARGTNKKMRMWHIGCALVFQTSFERLKAGSIPVIRSTILYVSIVKWLMRWTANPDVSVRFRVGTPK
jgi:hypothetical protein